MLKKPKAKKCVICEQMYYPYQTFQKVCGISCAMELAHRKAEEKAVKEFRKEQKRRKEALKTKNDYVKEAQLAFNAYVRERDKNEPCISCGRYHKGQWHAGHYRTTKAAPELRFHPFNNNKQCQPCNNHLSGNITEYRINLAKKIGDKNLEWLEGPHEIQHWTIDDLKEIKGYYNELTKQLKAAQLSD